MASVVASGASRTSVFFDRMLPLGHWLGAETGHNAEQGQARTRLMCTLAGLCGFVVAERFSVLPGGIIATAILFPLYAIGYAILVHRHPVTTHARRAFALLADNLVASYIASFGGLFAAYVGFNFLTTVGWGLRFGRHYLFLATAIAMGGMAWALAASPYWQRELLFGASILFGMLATSINTAMLLRRIKRGNRRLAEKMDEIAQLAWRDPLTKLSNRLHFRERLSQALAAAARNGRPLALLLFDLDGFKAVNDTLGHEAGDRMLQEIGARIARTVRQADTFARWGGDEFVILMDAVRERADAVRVAETVMTAVSEIDVFAGGGLRIGASVGIAWGAPRPGEKPNPDELLRLCDQAMYEAKRAGKGCYRFALTPG
ncbi:MAG TPA: GGDEF domain-containing protein [Burkholderiales bacterium]|nr:GGDEF domain-containing protein [Burkholderiales bacterium]